MVATKLIQLYIASAILFFAIDILWLGVIAKNSAFSPLFRRASQLDCCRLILFPLHSWNNDLRHPAGY